MKLLSSNIDKINSCFENRKKCFEKEIKTESPYNDHVYEELELDDYISDKCDTLTNSGKQKLREMLHETVERIPYEHVQKNIEFLKEKLTQFKELEEVLVFFSENNSSDLNALLGNTKFTFPLFTKLNKNKGAISALNMYYLINPFFSIISPIVLFVLTYLFSRFFFYKYIKMMAFSVPQLDLFKRGMLRGFFTLFMFIYSLYSSSILSYINYNLFKKEYEYIRSYLEIHRIISEIKEKLGLDWDISTSVKINTKFFHNNYSFFNDKGEIQFCFNEINSDKDNTNRLLEYFGILDAQVYLCEQINNSKMCLATEIENDTPKIVLEEFYSPLLDGGVSSSLTLDGEDAIIVAPNAQGKSTFLRAVGCCLLLAQQWGVVPAKKMEFTRFTNIDTYINVTDESGQKSLFQAEINRIKNYLTKLKDSPPDSFSFIIIDEILSSTNPKDGESASMAIAEKLRDYKNAIALISSHHHRLVELEDYRKFTLRDYTLKEEVNLTTNALDLMDIDDDIKRRAKEIKDSSVST